MEVPDSGKSDDFTEKLNISEKKERFKRPILIGKIGRLPRKIDSSNKSDQKIDEIAETNSTEKIIAENDTTLQTPCNEKTTKCTKVIDGEEKSLSLQYKEPDWSSLPQTSSIDYKFEVLKFGSVVDTINLMSKPFWVFGRFASCDINMQHPTISRYHAVLQYRNNESEDQEQGFYLYDLNSTHGTFLNKNRIKSKVYVKVKVGHMIKLGCSTRTYLLTGPESDVEKETEMSVTELKRQRAEELLKREETLRKQEEERLEKLRKEEERGIDWGMGDDADDETDLTENPYAQTNNEELYLDDPKKALRGFMEREGINWEYECSEQGIGQFLCKVMLPIDDDNGRPIVAEVLHKGKKKEAVVQCALEACRILDRYGVLRQAVHESRKRKAKNWEENDYYDSDEDTFLDRTGTIEKKRESRMKAKVAQQPETYESLLEKESKIRQSIINIEKQLSASTKSKKGDGSDNPEEDPLDSFMKELKQPHLDRQKISKLRSELSKLKQEHVTIVKLVNIAKPAELPPLKPHTVSESIVGKEAKNKALPAFGKRLKVKVQLPTKPDLPIVEDENEEEGVETAHNFDENEMDKQTKNAIKKPSKFVGKEKEKIEETGQAESSSVEDKDKIYSRNQDLEKKKKKNQKRIHLRQERTEIEKQKGYEEDALKEDYNMWVPPENQSGDGRTALNDKLGY